MYYEARSEPIVAQISTAKILQHRATINKTEVCKELARRKQFTWTQKYRISPPAPVGAKDKAAWQQSLRLSKKIKSLNVRGITTKHVFFNEISMGKRYKTKTKAKRIGRLLFY